MLRNRLAFSALFVLTLSPSVADAEETVADKCIETLDHGISLRKGGKIIEARSAFVSCSSTPCPKAVTTECTSHAEALRGLIPSMIFVAKNEKGEDLSSITVTMDGKLLTSTLNGTAIEIDPGEHEFAFQSAWKPTVTRKFVMHEGERDRREIIVIGQGPPGDAKGPPAATMASGGPGETKRAETKSDGWSATKTAGVVTMGAGALGLLTGGGAGIATFVLKGIQNDKCATSSSCSDRPTATTAHNQGETSAVVSNVAFGVGAGLAAIGAVLFFTAPKGESGERATVGVSPAVGPGLVGLSVHGGF